VRVGFDDQIFGRQRRGGISRYFTELMVALRAGPPDEASVTTPFRWVANDHIVDAFPGEFSRLRLPMRLSLDLVRLLGNRSAAAWAGVDVVHHTYYDPRYLRRAPGAVRVSTVHDMIPERLGHDLAGERIDKRRYVEASDAVICVSQATADDVLEIYGTAVPPISVIHLGVGATFFAPGPPPSLPTREFIVYVGLRGGYKDFPLVLEALASMPPSLRQLGLICVGGGGFTSAETATLQRLGIRGRVWQLDVAEPDLPGVYASAAVFVMPSRHEGFGLPVLEAMAAGCPAVLADRPVFREVAADAATYFDAGDVESLREEVVRTVGLPDADRRTRRDAGNRRAASFPWSRTATETSRVYADSLAAR
jgi:glycosyltransferase involved in cell wall biosynthesis